MDFLVLFKDVCRRTRAVFFGLETLRPRFFDTACDASCCVSRSHWPRGFHQFDNFFLVSSG